MEINRKIGVLVGRFQVAELHEGHTHLIGYALRENDAVVVMLGKGRALLSKRNPLPCPVRTRLVQESYPNVSVMELPDHPSDEAWSRQLDALLAKTYPDARITLYASRDSFVPYYSGTLPVIVLPAVPGVSGTNERAGAGDSKEWNVSFRKGMIAAQYMRPPLSYQAVDIAVIRYPEHEVLLGQKTTDGDQWRLIGGFVDASDTSLEAAALRELGEEAGDLVTHELSYAGSYRVDDWGYKSEEDKIMTALYVTSHLAGTPRAGDDLARVAWFPLTNAARIIVESHRPLIARVSEVAEKERLFCNVTLTKGDCCEHSNHSGTSGKRPQHCRTHRQLQGLALETVPAGHDEDLFVLREPRRQVPRSDLLRPAVLPEALPLRLHRDA